MRRFLGILCTFILRAPIDPTLEMFMEAEEAVFELLDNGGHGENGVFLDAGLMFISLFLPLC